MNQQIETILITARPGLALAAEKAGVSLVMVDLEINGKSERQPAGTTPIYRHTWDDVAKVRQVLRGTTKLLVRVNPPHEGSREEVEKALDLGADALMLPYFKTVKEIETFRSLVNGRVKTLFLFESSQAVAFAPMILDACEGEDVHFGLNDLMLAMGTRSPFDALAGGMIEWLARTAEEKKLFFGIGGVGRVGGANDKVPAELVLGEHVRLKIKACDSLAFVCRKRSRSRRTRRHHHARTLENSHDDRVFAKTKYTRNRKLSSTFRQCRANGCLVNSPMKIYASLVKPALDIVGGIVLSILSAPLIFILCVMIRWESRGNPVFKSA